MGLRLTKTLLVYQMTEKTFPVKLGQSPVIIFLLNFIPVQAPT